MIDIEKLYSYRFSERELRERDAIWRVLCNNYFQKYVSSEDTVLELGAGYGEFINNIRCKTKYAVEVNIDIKKFVKEDVIVYQNDATDLSCFKNECIDIVFASNFFEHLKNKEEMFIVIKEIHRILNKEGKLLILGPNIQYLANRYWNFIDHNIPLSHRSMVEALVIHNFKIVKVVPKFLPFTTKSLFPKYPWMVRLYLNFKFPRFIFGKQMFIVGEK